MQSTEAKSDTKFKKKNETEKIQNQKINITKVGHKSYCITY